MKLVRTAFLLAVFAGSLTLGCALLGRVQPLVEVPQVGEKLAWLAAHRANYQALFLGTSRVRRQIVPELFDRLAAEQGMAVRSFNLGVDSMMAPEDGFVLDQALALRLPNLRWVFIELSYFRSDFAGQEAETVRAGYWRDWTRTVCVWEHVLATRFKPRKKKRWAKWLAEHAEAGALLVTHARLFGQRAVNLGRGATWLARRTGTRPPLQPLLPLGPGLDGFIPATETSVLSGAALADFEREITATRQAPATRRALDVIAQRNLESMLAHVRAAGAEPILFIAPTLEKFRFLPAREVAPVLDFSRIEEWPELFEPQFRADAGHLNTAGAQRFTQRLAERFFALPQGPAKQR